MITNQRRSTCAAPRRCQGIAVLLAIAACAALGAEGSHAAEWPASRLPLAPSERVVWPSAFVVGYDPFEIDRPAVDVPAGQPAVYDPFDEPVPIVLPVSNAARVADDSPRLRNRPAEAGNEPAPVTSEPSTALHRAVLLRTQQFEAVEPPRRATVDPCAPAEEKPLSELTIEITLPAGELPRDFAATCWQQIDAAAPFAAVRRWHPFGYHWDATWFCHRPLYFEEINLERHGYGCHECLQPAVSAAHFFATVPALPYLMTVDRPGECIYTLGHYRPGSCPPWRHHWPPCDPLAAAAQGGVVTGLIFLIP